MKFSKVATFFDRDSVYDAYTGAFLFKAQFASFDGSQPDGSFSRRRTVSVAPGVAQPPRDVVTVHGEKWIVGQYISDGFFDKPVRKTASAKQVTGKFDIVSPAEAALNLPTTRWAYGQAVYLKDTVNTPTNSDYSPQYEISFGPTERVPDEIFLRTDTDTYHVRTVYAALEGFTIATADQIGTTDFGDNRFVQVFFNGSIDPMTEMSMPGVATTGILLYAYKLYTHVTEADPMNRPGDKTLIVAKSAVTPISGTELNIGPDTYRIFSVQSYYDSWSLRIRRS